ncbi:probable ATP-dependent RNA helicase DDX10 [Rhodnius prolixus]
MKKYLGKGKTKGKKKFTKKKQETRELEDNEIKNLQQQYEKVNPDDIETFEDIPLSSRTRKGLAENGYINPTDIQKESIIIALRGTDILGAAKTGSGKTLAFLIPVLEELYCKTWTKFDGLGALIITPTRELALQLYETLIKVGKYHDFSAGLIIGGKDVEFERSRMHHVNVIICTPGRLLQHMDENPLFDCNNLQILVLDEADRCLDLGFEREMDCIIQNLPSQRHTLLFSATQTKKVKDLARLSLVDPKYISAHEHEKYKTPDGLTQSYVICEQHEKMTLLWSFITTHTKQKILVFLSTCKQVKFIHEVFCHLRPRNTLLALHGRMQQHKRLESFKSFWRKEHAVLFATDIASRGLDFPQVHWVIHIDCPEDVETYIHRAGRTARYHKGGECLLVLNSSEIKFIEHLENNRIPINEIKVNPNHMISPQAKIEALLAKDINLKASAQRAFVAYAKYVFLMKDKSVFNIKAIDTDKYARSMGLVISPRIRFIAKADKKKENTNRDCQDSSHIVSIGPSTENTFAAVEGDDSDDNILSLKRKNHDIDNESEVEEEKTLPLLEESKKNKIKSRAKKAKLILKKKINVNKKTLYTDNGEAIIERNREKITEIGRNYDASAGDGINIDEAKKVLAEEDKVDREFYRQKMKAKRKLLKKKMKEQKKKKQEEIEEKSELNSASEDSDEEPDLSWLPDPEKVYSDEIKSHRTDSGGDGIKPCDRMFSSEDENESSEEEEDDLTLKEKEALALKMLSKC